MNGCVEGFERSSGKDGRKRRQGTKG
jgi:hypothetical protein